MVARIAERAPVPVTGRAYLRGRHVATGAALVAGMVAGSWLVSRRYAPQPANRRIRAYYHGLEKPPFQPPDRDFAVWGPLFVALAVSGLRVWNAPPSPARTRALIHWSGIQILDAAWMWLGFGLKRRGANAIEAGATVANALAYVQAARQVDRAAAAMVLPYLAWIGYAALLTEELWRRNRDAAKREVRPRGRRARA